MVKPEITEKMNSGLEEAVGANIYRENKETIDEMDEWDKCMLELLGLDGYKKLLDERDKRDMRRILIPIISTNFHSYSQYSDNACSINIAAVMMSITREIAKDITFIKVNRPYLLKRLTDEKSRSLIQISSLSLMPSIFQSTYYIGATKSIISQKGG